MLFIVIHDCIMYIFTNILKIPVPREGERTIREEEIQQRTKNQRQYEAEKHAQILQKERLMREMKFGALNMIRYRTLWREIMMRIKMPQIIVDVEVAWRNFDRALDIKEYRLLCVMLN